MPRYYYKDCYLNSGYRNHYNFEIWDRLTNNRIAAAHEIDDALRIIDALNALKNS